MFKYDFKWLNPITKKVERSRCAVPLIVGDCPERCEMANISYFSGTYGSQNCEIQTTEERNEKGQKVGGRIYNYNKDDKMRTLDSILKYGKQAEILNRGKRSRKKKKKVKGLLGITILSCLPLIDLSKCFVSEFMHSFCLGVFNQFLECIFFEYIFLRRFFYQRCPRGLR